LHDVICTNTPLLLLLLLLLLRLMQRWGYQDLQLWQDALITQVVQGPLALLQEQVKLKAAASS
jgi:hypothetical protein